MCCYYGLIWSIACVLNSPLLPNKIEKALKKTLIKFFNYHWCQLFIFLLNWRKVTLLISTVIREKEATQTQVAFS